MKLNVSANFRLSFEPTAANARRWVQRSAIGVCLMLLVFVAGCQKQTAKVSGTVILDGKPLKGGGTVTFEGDSGGVSGMITPEGTYAIANAPVGEVKITLAGGIETVSGAGIVPSGPPPMKKTPVKMVESAKPLKNIPEKYTVPGSTGLTFSVKPGEQTFDITLSSE